MDTDNEQMHLPRIAGGTTHLAVCLLCDFGLCVQCSLKKTGGSAEAETGGTEQANMF